MSEAILYIIIFGIGWLCGMVFVDEYYYIKWSRYHAKVQRKIKWYQARAGLKADGIL